MSVVFARKLESHESVIVGTADDGDRAILAELVILFKGDPGPHDLTLLGSAIKWNFTKFLVSPNGVSVKRYAPTTKPQDIRQDAEALLSQ